VTDSITHGPGLSELAHLAVSALGPEAGVLVDLDPALFGRALAHAAAAAARKPASSGAAGVKCAVGLTRATLAAASRLLGRRLRVRSPRTAWIVDLPAPAWEDNPAFFWLCQSHLVLRRPCREPFIRGIAAKAPDPQQGGDPSRSPMPAKRCFPLSGSTSANLAGELPELSTSTAPSLSGAADERPSELISRSGQARRWRWRSTPLRAQAQPAEDRFSARS